MTELYKMYGETLSKLRKEKRELILGKVKDIGIGLIAGGIFMIVSGWLYFVTVMAR